MAFPFLIAALLIGLVGVFLFLSPKPHIENARASKLSDFSFPRSNKGDPVPIIKGTTRLRYPNTIGLGGFRADPIQIKVSTGLFTSKKQTIGYKYHVTLGLGMCLGPGARIKRIWFGKYTIWTGSAGTGDSLVINLPELYGGKDKNGGVGGTIRVYGGDFDQSQDPKLASVVDPNYPAWPGLAYLVFDDFWFGNSTNIEPIHIEVQMFSDVLALPEGKNIMGNGLDENPVETIADIIASKNGKLGFGVEVLDSVTFTATALVIWGEGNGGSWEIANPNRGVDLVKELIRQIEATIYQDPIDGLIKIKLLREDYDIEDLPILDPSNVLAIKNLSKTLWEQTINQIRIKFRDRADQYADDAAQDQDFANINMQNKVRSTELTMPGVYTAELAQILAARERSKVSVPLYGFEITVNREMTILRPGDPFVLTWPQYGIEQIVMRVRTFDLGSLDKGEITIMAAQDSFAVNDVIYLPPTGSFYTPPNFTADEIEFYITLETPFWFLKQADPTKDGLDAYAWALPRRPDENSLSYMMAVSTDAFATYVLGLELAAYQGAAKLSGAYGASDADDGYDSGVTGIVIDELDGVFIPTSGGDIQNEGANLIIIGTEILGYETVTDLGAGSYRLTGIRRALLDTEVEAHADNAIVVFLDGIDGLYDQAYPGTGSIDFRLLDHTHTETFDVSAADTITLNFDRRAERPLPPDHVTAGGVRTGSAARSATMAIAWKERNRLDPVIRYENDATVAPEALQENELKWRINAGAWTTAYITGVSTTIDTSLASAADTLHVELRSRRGGLLSRIASKCDITLT